MASRQRFSSTTSGSSPRSVSTAMWSRWPAICSARRRAATCWARCSGVRPSCGREAQQVCCHQRDRAPRALLPRRIGGGLHDDLAHDAPAGVMGFTARNQEARERLRQELRVGLEAIRVEVAQRLADAATAIDGSRQLSRRGPGPPLNTGRRQPSSEMLRVTIAMLALRRGLHAGALDGSARLTLSLVALTNRTLGEALERPGGCGAALLTPVADRTVIAIGRLAMAMRQLPRSRSSSTRCMPMVAERNRERTAQWERHERSRPDQQVTCVARSPRAPTGIA